MRAIAHSHEFVAVCDLFDGVHDFIGQTDDARGVNCSIKNRKPTVGRDAACDALDHGVPLPLIRPGVSGQQPECGNNFAGGGLISSN